MDGVEASIVRSCQAFRLVPTNASSSDSSGNAFYGEQWLGRDLHHVLNELNFYDQALRLRSRRGWAIFDRLADYRGTLQQFTCASPGLGGEERILDLLVFRSPLEGLARPRLLNMEIGARAANVRYPDAAACSRLQSAQLARAEGIRVEGLLSPPSAWDCSEEPGGDVRSWAWGGDALHRRAARDMLQKLSLAPPCQALAALVDLRDAVAEERRWPSLSWGTAASAHVGARTATFEVSAATSVAVEFLTACEYAELALLAFVRELALLVRACADVPVPQKWVGSSIGFLVETGAAPPRHGPIDPEAWVAARVKLRLFGWSRSQVSVGFDDVPPLGPSFGAAPMFAPDGSELFWSVYRASLGWILWEAARYYLHSFTATQWKKLRISINDDQKKSAKGDGNGERHLGSAELNLENITPGSQELLLMDERRAQVQNGDGTVGSVVILVEVSDLPKPSRFASMWRVQIVSVSGLPHCPPLVGTCSETPVYNGLLVDLSLEAPNGRCTIATSMLGGEGLEFPVASPGAAGRLWEALVPSSSEDVAVMVPELENMLPPLVGPLRSNASEQVMASALGQTAFHDFLLLHWPKDAGTIFEASLDVP